MENTEKNIIKGYREVKEEAKEMLLKNGAIEGYGEGLREKLENVAAKDYERDEFFEEHGISEEAWE